MSFNPENFPVYRISAEFTDKDGFKWVMGGLYIASPSKEVAAKRVGDLIGSKRHGCQVSVSFRECDEFEAKMLQRKANGHDPFTKKSVWNKLKDTFIKGKDDVAIAK